MIRTFISSARTFSTTGFLSHSVVIGGNTAGLLAVKTLMQLDPNHQVTIISPNDRSFPPPVTPRLLVKPDLLAEASHPFETILKGMKYNHVRGMATKLTPESNSVSVKLLTGDDTEIKYDNVIVCSGSRSREPMYKVYDSLDRSVEALRGMNKRLSNAKRVCVLGGGATGVETAAEIKENFSVHVDLFSGDVHPTMFFGPGRIQEVEEKLEQIDVHLFNNIRPKVLTETSLEVEGEVKEYDVIIDATGVLPNNDFLPKHMLDYNGYLKCDLFFKTKYDNVFGLGDILSVTSNTLVDLLHYQTEVFSPLMEATVLKRPVELVKYNDNHPMTCAVPITSTMGVGEVGGWGIPSFMVVLGKSRDYMIKKTVNLFQY